MNHFQQQRSHVWHIFSGLLFLVIFFPCSSGAAPASDEFIRGYAAAILQRDFQITVEKLNVQSGVIYIRGLEAPDEVRDRMKSSLSSIEGVSQVFVVEDGKITPTDGKSDIATEVNVFLPRDLLFKSLLADPRWPHFSVSYQQYQQNSQLERVGSTSFGETFSFYRFGGPWNSQMEVGLQAGVFSIFDMDADSLDLVNADYYVAIPLSLKKDNFSAMARIFHQSSHLGDEYLLSGQAQERINLSYEGFGTLLSYNFPLGFRIYGGGGYLFDRDPSDLRPWLAQSGLEFRSSEAWLGGALRPIVALDLQNFEEGDWDTNVSLRAGVQLENPVFLSRKLQILIEYYNGSSPNGQFYARDPVEFIGLGFHFFYD
ncbi:Protein of unknown function (DUF1207) [Desulfocapsa sulfexigens DSM 10523]|uniref:DUF1207 domain-containing protein n=1 Tax=Desulfocapsa sulfexigens (strain DSM 10523 / SB164P1) TaxID=1167006 RepID=M1PMA4_DESSD|nr:DUF1207 domain-containing protein [Desulfocapsa sulfexigens]AGF77566.1 Protein of unknown function (DUF1207) [Desulfocapsa sulfexigens DSM 10523]